MRIQATSRLYGGLLLLALGLAAGVAACAPWGTTARQVLRLDLTATGISPGEQDAELDPAQSFSGEEGVVTALLYSGLTTLDAHNNPVLWDADHVDISADGLTYTFHLRANLHFADGAPITASAFAFSLNRALSPCFNAQPGLSAAPAPFAYVLATLRDAAQFQTEQCDAHGALSLSPGQQGLVIQTLIGDALQTPDDATLTIHLAQPDSSLLAELALPVAYVIEPSLAQRYPQSWWQLLAEHDGQGTSGMYRLAGETEEAHITTLRLLRDDRAGGPFTPRLSEVDLVFKSDRAAVEGDYTAGRIDAIWPVPIIENFPAATPGDVRDSYGVPDVRFGLTDRLFAIEINQTEPPFDDPRVRQAFSLALDRTELAAHYPREIALPTYHLIPEGQPGYYAGLTLPFGVTSLKGDPARAATLWQSYVGERCQGSATQCPSVNMQVFTYTIEDEEVIQELAAQWRQTFPGLAITVHHGGTYRNDPTVRQLTNSTYGAPFADPCAWLAACPEPIDPYGDTLRAFYGDPRAEADLRAMEATRDPQTRLTLANAAEQAMVSDATSMPLFQLNTAWQAKSYVERFSPGPWDWISAPAWCQIGIAAH